MAVPLLTEHIESLTDQVAVPLLTEQAVPLIVQSTATVPLLTEPELAGCATDWSSGSGYAGSWQSH